MEEQNEKIKAQNKKIFEKITSHQEELYQSQNESIDGTITGGHSQ